MERSDLDHLVMRVVKLEEVVTHQQQALHQLDEVLLELRKKIDRMATHSDERINRLQFLLDSQLGDDDLPHEKPPHY